MLGIGWGGAVSYTHLDVYKRQTGDGLLISTNTNMTNIVTKYEKRGTKLTSRFEKGRVMTYDR